MEVKEFRPGLVPSMPDSRDYVYSDVMMAAPKELPAKYTLPITANKNQKDFGACVGFGCSNMKDTQESFNHPSKGIVTAPAFIYTECKKIDNIPVEGTNLRSAMKVLLDKGVCLERTCPYDDSKMKQGLPTITKEMYDEAKNYKIGSYLSVRSLDEMKHSIVSGSPVALGLMVTESFCHPTDGFMNMPKGNILGGHCVEVCGYDDNLEHTYEDGTKLKGFFLMKQSWKPDWGLTEIPGYAWIPYAFITGGDFPPFAECWVTKDVIMPNPPAKTVILWVDSTKAVVDGADVTLDQAPTIDKNTLRTLLPLRFMSEIFGYKVNWNADKKQILITKDDDQLLVTIGSSEALFNNKFIWINQPPIVDPETKRTLVPVRFFSEVFGYSVNWDPRTKQITITA